MTAGFDIIETVSDTFAANTNLITNYSLPDDYPPQLATFLHLSLSLATSTVVNIIKNSQPYPIENNNALQGEVYRSFQIKKGDVINVQVETAQVSNSELILSLEK